jgi:hypothetical protein
MDNQVSNFLAFLLRVKGPYFVATPSESVQRSRRIESHVAMAPHLLILTFWKAKRFPPELRRRRLSRGSYSHEMHVELHSDGASDQCHFSLERSRSANGVSSLR